jgi:hypothetical protein
MHHDLNNLYATKAVATYSYSPSGHIRRSPVASAIQSRGPWLSGALCCRSRSSLTMASSESVCPSRRLISFVHRIFALRPRMDWNRQIPQFAPRICDSVPPSVPRWTGGVPLAVSSSPVIAFAISAQARHPHAHAHRFPREKCNEAAKFTSCYGPVELIALLRQGRLLSSFHRVESPQPDVEYVYTGKQPIPAAGLTPARYAALWAANRDHRNRLPERFCFNALRKCCRMPRPATGGMGGELH